MARRFGDSNEDLLEAARQDTPAGVAIAVRNGATNLDQALVTACEYSHLAVAKALIVHGADVSLCKIRWDRNTLIDLYEQGARNFGQYQPVIDAYLREQHLLFMAQTSPDIEQLILDLM